MPSVYILLARTETFFSRAIHIATGDPPRFGRLRQNYTAFPGKLPALLSHRLIKTATTIYWVYGTKKGVNFPI